MAKKKSLRPKSKGKNKVSTKSWILIFVLSLISASLLYLLFLRNAIQYEEKEVIINIPRDKTNKEYVKSEISKYVDPLNYNTFLALAELTRYWENIKPGKYPIKKNTSNYSLFRKLYSGKQKPVKLVINKFRTKKDLARYLGNKLEYTEEDFLRFFSNEDSLESFGLTNETMMTIIIPNTYEVYWDSNPREFMDRMQKESNKFWNSDRIENAKKVGLSKVEITTIASIIEEETNNNEEKPLMASVYINRLNKGMPLGADPTIKFALGDFTLRRILFEHINKTATSPYNTYKNKGLPPGPICTPSISSIDAVLKGEETSYLYFCAKEDFSGSHNFASTAEEHMENAKKYRKALDSLKIH